MKEMRSAECGMRSDGPLGVDIFVEWDEFGWVARTCEVLNPETSGHFAGPRQAVEQLAARLASKHTGLAIGMTPVKMEFVRKGHYRVRFGFGPKEAP